MSVSVGLGAFRQFGYQRDRVDSVTNPGAPRKLEALRGRGIGRLQAGGPLTKWPLTSGFGGLFGGGNWRPGDDVRPGSGSRLIIHHYPRPRALACVCTARPSFAFLKNVYPTIPFRPRRTDPFDLALPSCFAGLPATSLRPRAPRIPSSKSPQRLWDRRDGHNKPARNANGPGRSCLNVGALTTTPTTKGQGQRGNMSHRRRGRSAEEEGGQAELGLRLAVGHGGRHCGMCCAFGSLPFFLLAVTLKQVLTVYRSGENRRRAA